MTVYVDNARNQLGRMILCHMIADTSEELEAMARHLGMPAMWRHGDHYDVSTSRRTLAIKAGAVAITWRQAAAMRRRLEVTGQLGLPSEAAAWFSAHRAERGGRAA